MTTWVEFNVNDFVRVKLTEHGKYLLLTNGIPLPREDKDGYSEYQMHKLMFHFGEYCYIGGETPFETNILMKRYDQTP